ncbi:hypothetical protein [Dyadobacter sp. NIV53]|uniref:hypothetical protein n=1 Tax=Dyadobacter sp. NIV53 TaxID=2861765 RepID=UPI001C8802D8|nr:hypothetical protein [Dyadobacter sp. NIV53]
MKNQKTKLLALLLVFFMYNCKDKDEAFPEKPSTEITDKLEAVAVAPITVDAPVAVASTNASVESSAELTGLQADLAALSSGAIPASVTAANTAVTSALSSTEISALSSVSAETIQAAFQTGVVSADIKAIIAKAKANPALAAYLTKFVFPTVSGVEVKGLRVGGTGDIDKAAKINVSDACIVASEAAFQAVKVKLDASKITETAKVTTAYNGWIAGITTSTATCTTSVAPTYAAYRTGAQNQAIAFLASLDAAQTTLGALYPTIKGLVYLSLLDYLSSVTELEAADSQKCTVYATALTTAANTAQTANLAKVDVNYKAALAEANALKLEAIESCHNQGGGN